MNKLQQTQLQLLSEIYEICQEAEIPVVLIGDAAASIAKTGTLAPSIIEPWVLMSPSGAKRFWEQVEQKNTDRSVECLGNSPEFPGIHMNYVAENTTLVNYTTVVAPKKQGIRIRIHVLHTSGKKDKEWRKIAAGTAGRQDWMRGRLGKKWKSATKYMDSVAKKGKLAEVYNQYLQDDELGETGYLWNIFDKISVQPMVLQEIQVKEVEGYRIPIPKCVETYALDGKGVPRNWKFSGAEPTRIIVSDTTGYEEFFRSICSQSAFRKIQKRVWWLRFFEGRTKKAEKYKSKAWNLAKRTGDRIHLYEEYQPKMDEIRGLWQAKDYEALEGIMEAHQEAVIRNYRNGLALSVDPFLTEVQLELLRRKNVTQLASWLEDKIPAAHRTGIYSKKEAAK